MTRPSGAKSRLRFPRSQAREVVPRDVAALADFCASSAVVGLSEKDGEGRGPTWEGETRVMLNSCPSCSKQRAREEELLGEGMSGSFDAKACSASTGWVDCVFACVPGGEVRVEWEEVGTRGREVGRGRERSHQRGNTQQFSSNTCIV